MAAQQLESQRRHLTPYAGELTLTAHQKTMKQTMEVRGSREGGDWRGAALVFMSGGGFSCLACFPANTKNKAAHDAPTHPQGIIYAIVNRALHHVAMRPTQEQVDREVAEWNANRHESLMMISRHMGER